MNRWQRAFGLALGGGVLASALAFAAPNPRVGIQMGYLYDEETRILVQAGTRYELHGLAGDHDIYFFDGFFQLVGSGYEIGPESGTVPSTAVYGVIVIFDHTGEAQTAFDQAWSVVSCEGPVPVECGPPPDPFVVEPPASMWLYIDGL